MQMFPYNLPNTHSVSVNLPPPGGCLVGNLSASSPNYGNYASRVSSSLTAAGHSREAAPSLIGVSLWSRAAKRVSQRAAARLRGSHTSGRSVLEAAVKATPLGGLR